MAFFLSAAAAGIGTALGVSTAAGALIGVSAVGTAVSVHGQLTAGKQAEADAKQAAENDQIFYGNPPSIVREQFLVLNKQVCGVGEFENLFSVFPRRRRPDFSLYRI